MDFDVEALDLLTCTFKLEMLVYHHTTGRLCPWAVMDILSRIPQEVEIGEESILNHVIPRQVWPRGGNCGCNHVVVVKSIAYCLGPGSQGCCNVFSKLIP